MSAIMRPINWSNSKSDMQRPARIIQTDQNTCRSQKSEEILSGWPIDAFCAVDLQGTFVRLICKSACF
jgi:hypothetical protein